MRPGQAPPGGEIGAKLIDQATDEEAKEHDDNGH